MSKKVIQRDVEVRKDVFGKESRRFRDEIYNPWKDRFDRLLEEIIWEKGQENRPKSNGEEEEK